MIIIADCITVLFDGQTGAAIRVLLMGASVFGYSLQVLICLFWFWYVRVVVFSDRKLLEKTAAIQGFPAFICVGVSVISCWTGWFFRYDENNAYQRGPLFALIAGVSFLYLISGYYMIIRYRKNLDRRHLRALLSFALPPTIGGIIQTFLYGVTLLWPCMTISLLIIYMSIQNELLLLDYLTGINNRRGFDQELRRRIANAKNTPLFALILIDLDNFRSINDRFGHMECDSILKTFAKILEACFRHNGFVARYGGDEFAVIVEIEHLKDMNVIRENLQTRIDEWNDASKKPWNISVSMGSAPYIPSEKLTQDNFLMQVDRLLSLDKIIPGERRFRAGHRP